jgi:hypothetical protein
MLDEWLGDNALIEIADSDCRKATVYRQLQPLYVSRFVRSEKERDRRS